MYICKLCVVNIIDCVQNEWRFQKAASQQRTRERNLNAAPSRKREKRNALINQLQKSTKRSCLQSSVSTYVANNHGGLLEKKKVIKLEKSSSLTYLVWDIY